MITELSKIFNFILEHLIHVWPYILVSIPISVAVKMTGASKYISKVFNKKPVISIILATLVGALSPFCSCGVIPIIASLLIGGVPLAPVMSFWLASPSMDPEMFFVSVAMVGWNLAVWRLAATFFMSLSGGFITDLCVKKGWMNEKETIKAKAYAPGKSLRGIIEKNFRKLYSKNFTPVNKFSCTSDDSILIKNNIGLINDPSSVGKTTLTVSQEIECCNDQISNKNKLAKIGCCSDEVPNKINSTEKYIISCGCEKSNINTGIKSGCCSKDIKSSKTKNNFWKKLFGETSSATLIVIKFMALAYFLESLIIFYVPQQFISLVLGKNQFVSIILAAIIGVPVYTSSLPALALVSGLISHGMAQSAALAFLVSGPTTTIPAMAAVWNLASRKVFTLYVGITLLSAICAGVLFYLSTIIY